MKCVLLGALLFSSLLQAQRLPDFIYANTIKSAQLFQQNNQLSLPIINLGSDDLLELHFDDMDATIKNYYYTFELCNADWQPVNLSTFDYLRGFQQQRLSQYRVSTIAQVTYVHYQTLLPNSNCMPTKSGNYLLKVFLNGDTAQLAFTKKMYVINKQVSITTSIQQPYGSQLANSTQKVQVSVNLGKLNPVTPQQVTTVMMQNNRMDNAVTGLQPIFIRGNVYEYNGEQDCLFPAGKEYRWADLRSFRFASDRIHNINKNTLPNEVYLRPDGERANQRYLYYRDYNGWWYVDATESINPILQGDYAWVYFTYIPKDNLPYLGKELHLVGALTGNQIGDSSFMQYNNNTGVYEKKLLLKQGYYSYTYATKDTKSSFNAADATITEGNYWETENDYTIFVYYRSLSGRHDELVGFVTVNSRGGRSEN